MHWSGVVRIIAIATCVALGCFLSIGLRLPWYVWLPVSLSAILVVPVVIGIVWGMIERPQIEREMLELARKLTETKPD